MLCVPCVVALLKDAGLVMEVVPLVQHYEDGHCDRKKQRLIFPNKSRIDNKDVGVLQVNTPRRRFFCRRRFRRRRFDVQAATDVRH